MSQVVSHMHWHNIAVSAGVVGTDEPFATTNTLAKMATSKAAPRFHSVYQFFHPTLLALSLARYGGTVSALIARHPGQLARPLSTAAHVPSISCFVELTACDSAHSDS